MTKSFEAQLKDWVDLTNVSLKYVAVNAISDVLEAAQTPQVAISKGATSFVEGKIPVAESELINSLQVNEGAKGPAVYETALLGFEIGEVMRFSWTADYAYRIELGFVGTDKAGRTYNQAGRHFVGANAAKFSQFVEKYAREVRS